MTPCARKRTREHLAGGLALSALLCCGSSPAQPQTEGPTSQTAPEGPVAPSAPGASGASGAAGTDTRLPQVLVRGRRPLDLGPLPGLGLTREQIPANVQSADKEELRRSGALSLGEYMHAQMPSVTVNDYAGNPFQFDLSYRGFTASPQIGTPQGLSVFFDGVRVNEPFGDVVNWDLLPMNAIERFDLFPGSNPLFGLNTLGGALSLRSRSGFSAPGFDGQLQFGRFGRRQLQLAGGVHGEDLAGFIALTHFEERGWRDNSPSTVQQLFARADARQDWGSVGLSLLAAGNDLVGNGLIPLEDWRDRPASVFTSPDRTKNRLLQGSLSGLLDLSETFSLTGQLYRRSSRRSGVNGDIYEGFEDFEPDVDRPRNGRIPHGTSLPPCAYLDANRDGQPDRRLVEDPDTPGVFIPDFLPPLNDPEERGLCDRDAFRVDSGPPRNGVGQTGERARGVVEGTPIGQLSRTSIEQLTDGGSLQLNWNLPTHKLLLGASMDASAAEYRLAQRLGLIDAGRNVYAAPEEIDELYRAAQVDVRANDFDGTSRTRSVYFSETWSPRSDLHLNVGARYNHTRVHTRLLTRSAIGTEAGDLHNLRNFNLLRQRLLCPTPDLDSCPAEPSVVLRDVETLSSTPTGDKVRYESFNPTLGASWLPTPGLNLYGNWSRGTRAPSVVELGCAFDGTLVDLNAGRTDDANGEPLPPLLRPRSLLGPTCTLPTTLSGDPYLPQIVATSIELGARGRLGADWGWSFSLYRTDLKDDIYFVGVSAERSFFDTIGKTRREGLELGLDGRLGPVDLKLNYSYTDASFQSRFYVLSPRNSSADFDQNSIPGTALPTPGATANGDRGTFQMIRVDPGARMPGLSLHNLNASATLAVDPRWSLTLGLVAHSHAYMRGNENNAHAPAGSDAITTPYIETCTTAGDCLITGGETLPGRRFTQPGRVPGHAVWNLRSSLKLDRHVTLTLGVANLFDRRYLTAGRLGFNPFSPSTEGTTGPSGWNYNSGEWRNTGFVGPGAPRTVTLGVEVQLGGD